MPQSARLVTAEELEHFPDDYRYELVDGHVIKVSPTGVAHGIVTMNLGVLLGQYIKAHDAGVLMVETGFTLARDPDTVRGPDLSFVRRERMLAEGLRRRGFWQGPPDLAVEVLSPDDRPAEIRKKVDGYLSTGVTLVWIVDPDARTITVCRRMVLPVTLSEDDMLDAGDLIPGFQCSVRPVFE